MFTASRKQFLSFAACTTIVACSSTTSPPPVGTGTLSGVVTNSSGVGLPGVSVQATPSSTLKALPAVTTDANGAYTIPNVPTGTGAVALSGVPSTCTAPSPNAYPVITAGGTSTDNIVVACTATNSLVIVVTGANGVTPSAKVTGPGGYSKTVTATTTLTGLASGSYTVAGSPASSTVSGPIVSATYRTTVLGSPASVSSSAVDTVSVSYNADGTGALWFDGGLAVTAAQLGSTATVTPADSCNAGNYGSAPFAFDTKGSLWMQVSYQPSNSGNTETALIQFDTTQLGVECDVAQPHLVLTGAALTNSAITAMAFDAHGTLWLAATSVNTNAAYLIGYSAAQLQAGGSPTPAYTISATSAAGGPGVLTIPQWLAFDGAGNLWVADQEGQVLEYTPAQLASSGAPTPAVLATSGTATDFPMFLAFDATGNLWIVDPNYGTSSPSMVSEFSKSALASLASNQSPSSIFTLTASETSINWNAIAFDNSGNLWMLTETTNSAVLVRYPAANIGPSGNGHSDIAIAAAVAGNFGLWIAFNPTPTGLPLVGSRAARLVRR